LISGSLKVQRVLVLGMFSVIVTNLLTHTGFISRISFYFDGFLIVAVPIAVLRLFSSDSRLYVLLAFFAASAILYFRAIIASGNGVTPYSSWLF